MALYLGVDCGTQGTKALVVDEAGQAVGRGYARHALVEGATGAREQEPVWWVEAMVAAVRQALAPEQGRGTAREGSRAAVGEGSLTAASEGLRVVAGEGSRAGKSGGRGAEVRAMGVSGQQHGLVVLDGEGRVIRPAKLWNDTETAAENEEMVRRLGGKAAWFERFGVVPLTGYTVSKLLWLKEREPENFARVRHVLLPHEYLNWWLTGEMRAEAGDASGTGFFDNRSRAWRAEVLEAIDGGTGQLAGALPPLLEADGIVGRLRMEAAEALGLSAGVLVAAGGGDNMMGAIGTGNVREGVVTLSLGTSSTVYSYSERPVEDRTGNVAPFCSSTGGWLPLVCTMNATNVVTGTVQLLGRGVEAIEPALEGTPVGADGLVFLPFLNGERTPDLPGARGSLVGLTAGNFSAEHLIRAAVEGVSFGILNGLELVLAGRQATVLQVIGGGARSRGWRQLLADATGAEVQTPEEEESGCLGAAMQAMVAEGAAEGRPESFVAVAERCVRVNPEGTAHPRAELRTAYDAARARYNEELQRLYGVAM